MNNKKIVAGLMALTLVFGGTALPNTVVSSVAVISANAEEETEVLTYGDFKYTLLEDSTVEITRYNGLDEEIEVPAEIDGAAVTSIGDNAFAHPFIKSIVIPDSVAKIGNKAFAGCWGLKSITLPKNLECIGRDAFGDCRMLKSIVIPDGVKSIGHFAFYDCFNLESIVIPDSVESIGNGAFSRCTKLKSITIPASVTQIGSEVFFELNLVINCYKDSAAEKYAKANNLNYKLIDEKLPVCPPPYLLRAECSEEYHQIRFKWDPIGGAEKYGIAVYLSGKWRVWTCSIPATTTTFTTPKNLTPGRTYKVAMAAKVNGKWNTTDPIKNAVTVTVK